MKKKLNYFLLAALVVCFNLLATDSSAQVTRYEWSGHGISFAIPNTHKIKHNADDFFESGDNLTWLEMYPYKDASVTAKGMIMDVAKADPTMRILDEGSYKTGGYDGYWITCEENSHPDWQYWYIGFIDPKSDTNFYAKIWFKKGNSRAQEIANKMSTSFKKI
jgi:hypothetical protein